MESCYGRNDKETLIFPCAGASHVGQVTNRAAIELTLKGKGQMFCLAAMSARIEDKLKRAREAGRRIAIDGCEDHCARKTLELAGLAVDAHVVLTTELGMEKKPASPNMIGDSRRVVELAEQKMDQIA
ncbi:MAG: putative zinc-binding protein [Planctomycetes bacterium]|nr:putative zinc-binding protein [Planctomycetota bacterium]